MIKTGNWEAPEGGVNENTGIRKMKRLKNGRVRLHEDKERKRIGG
jgi:hypothetical protein